MHPNTRFKRTHILTPRSYAPTGFTGAAFKESPFTASGSYDFGYLTGRETDLRVDIARNRGQRIVPDVTGALTIHSERRPGSFVRLDVVAHARKLTGRQAEDLEIIARSEHRARVVRDGHGHPVQILAGLCAIPRVQTEILLQRGWLAEQPYSDRVWISTAGRMAMAHRYAATEGLNTRVLKGLYLDAALTAATRARLVNSQETARHAEAVLSA
ncbi:hypothetical protein [Streptomyces sp. NRRL S-350]|uniref:hypothetical protein n=1 Tax=Streptomyces sp. NRRL S-350 TaxID=1463902 RepID=UPI0004BF700D|nr:hypothetical protein [Streptomyces sp. NRRL S-350]